MGSWGPLPVNGGRVLIGDIAKCVSTRTVCVLALNKRLVSDPARMPSLHRNGDAAETSAQGSGSLLLELARTGNQLPPARVACRSEWAVSLSALVAYLCHAKEDALKEAGKMLKHDADGAHAGGPDRTEVIRLVRQGFSAVHARARCSIKAEKRRRANAESKRKSRNKLRAIRSTRTARICILVKNADKYDHVAAEFDETMSGKEILAALQVELNLAACEDRLDLDARRLCAAISSRSNGQRSRGETAPVLVLAPVKEDRRSVDMLSAIDWASCFKTSRVLARTALGAATFRDDRVDFVLSLRLDTCNADVFGAVHQSQSSGSLPAAIP